jgi:hypothetical protein
MRIPRGNDLSNAQEKDRVRLIRTTGKGFVSLVSKNQAEAAMPPRFAASFTSILSARRASSSGVRQERGFSLQADGWIPSSSLSEKTEGINTIMVANWLGASVD